MLIRPANYAEDLCGNSYYVYEHPTLGKKIGVIDLIGRVDMGGSFDATFGTMPSTSTGSDFEISSGDDLPF
jgi:calcineurin-like phosphoesterase